MSAGDTARQSYDAVRQEILMRMRLRDQVLMVFLAVTGTILGVSTGTENRLEIAMVIPYLGLGAALLVTQHNTMAAYLGQFCCSELDNFLMKLKPSESAPQWDNSATFNDYAIVATSFRMGGHALIIAVPCLLALGVNIKHIFSPFPKGIMWWFGAVCFLMAIVVIAVGHSIRRRIYRERVWRSKT